MRKFANITMSSASELMRHWPNFSSAFVSKSSEVKMAFRPALREQLRANGGWPADTNAPVANGLQPSLETKSSLK
jgi:hypothetical protein